MLGAVGLAPGKQRIGRIAALRRWAKDRRGAAAAEFALIAPMLVLVLVGIAEIGTTLFVGALMEGAVREASRYGITGQGGAARMQTVRDIIEDTTIGLVDIDVADIGTKTYADFDSIGQHEPYTDDNPPNGTFDVGEAYVDINGNGEWDTDQGKDGVGDPGEIVVYDITYDLPLLTGMLTQHFGQGGLIKMKSRIAVRNEPFHDDGLVP